MTYTKEQLFGTEDRPEAKINRDGSIAGYIIGAYQAAVLNDKDIGLSKGEKESIESLDPDISKYDICLTDLKFFDGQDYYDSLESLKQTLGLDELDESGLAEGILSYFNGVDISFDVAIFDKESGIQIAYFQDQSFLEMGPLLPAVAVKDEDFKEVDLDDESEINKLIEENESAVNNDGPMFFRSKDFNAQGAYEDLPHGLCLVNPDFFSQTDEDAKEALKALVYSDFNPLVVEQFDQISSKGLYVNAKTLFGLNSKVVKDGDVEEFNLAFDEDNSEGFAIYLLDVNENGVRSYVYTINGIGYGVLAVIAVTPSISPRFVGRLGSPDFFPN